MFLEKNFRRKISCTSILHATFSDKGNEEKWKKLLEEFSGSGTELFYVLFDEAQYFREKYNAFHVGKFGSSPAPAPFLVQLCGEVRTPNHSIVERISSTLKELNLEENYLNFCVFSCDATSCNKTAAENIRGNFESLIHISCPSNMLAIVGLRVFEKSHVLPLFSRRF